MLISDPDPAKHFGTLRIQIRYTVQEAKKTYGSATLSLTHKKRNLRLFLQFWSINSLIGLEYNGKGIYRVSVAEEVLSVTGWGCVTCVKWVNERLFMSVSYKKLFVSIWSRLGRNVFYCYVKISRSFFLNTESAEIHVPWIFDVLQKLNRETSIFVPIRLWNWGGCILKLKMVTIRSSQWKD